jgi:nucleoid-associated protein YgaU
MKLWHILVLSIVISAIGFGGCVRDRSPEALHYTVESLEKQLEDADREYSRLIEERQRLEGNVLEAERLAKRTDELLKERKRLEEELAVARIELERSRVENVAGDTTGKIRRTDADTVAEDLTAGGTPGYPDMPTELPFTPSEEKIHIVSKGEYLSKIAGYEEYYDDQSSWPYIYIYNAAQIKDPHWIFEGQQLYIPIQ